MDGSVIKPALLKAIPERYEKKTRHSPIKRGSGQSGWVGVAGLIGSQVVFQIGGGKNRALNSGCLNLIWAENAAIAQRGS